VIDPVENLDDLFRQARVLLVPSLWAEARSRIVVEAMLRGVPVMASDTGGLKEAKLGVPYLLPVNPITQYQSSLDENMVPVATVPEQDIGPWLDALRRLTGEQAHWGEISAQSRVAALNYASTLTVEPFETFLLQLLGRPKRRNEVAPKLSDDKRKLLALRLKRRAWFPTLEAKSRATLRLFCFPYAGAGALAYREWSSALPGIDVVPVLPPGRETRLSERPFEDMRELIDALTPVIRPLAEMPYAFFGHSMGSGIAFELARSLRRVGAPLPRVLIVSSARAPQDRTSPKREPSDAELVEELAGLGELTPQAVDLILPILHADTRLYRNYVYQPEPPLGIPIVTYGGASDPNLTAEQLDEWRRQTTDVFIRREFAGGHFYLTEDPDRVLGALRLDLGCK
jgi:medium-chain acyl-[acyl-carrier-protein] hydrolase